MAMLLGGLAAVALSRAVLMAPAWVVRSARRHPTRGGRVTTPGPARSFFRPNGTSKRHLAKGVSA
jgi:hypothetical protein